MKNFFMNLLDRNKDGLLSGKESIIVAGAAIVLLLALIFLVFRLAERNQIRKTSIFRVKKNKYKSRLGKKNIKY